MSYKNSVVFHTYLNLLMNTEHRTRYEDLWSNAGIQSECRKIRTRKNSVFLDTFYVVQATKMYKVMFFGM